MNIKNVAKYRFLQNGIFQSFFMESNFEIIISKVDSGIELKRHAHKEKQVGILLEGRFIFKTDEDILEMKEQGNNYIIKSGVYHGAEALENFCAFDYKYNFSSNILEDNLQKNTLKESCKMCFCLNTIQFFLVKKQKLKIKLDSCTTYYFIASDTTSILLNKKLIIYNKMEILLFKTDEIDTYLILTPNIVVVLINSKKKENIL